jgi:uncharacterized membrane-anchored protein YjiN (DUF445 family)
MHLMTRTVIDSTENGVLDAGDRAKRTALRRMKALASALLIAMLLVFAISATWRAALPWLNWVHAFAEAAAIGALADWFAVTALFRHPLGLPIPHTAIIPRNKNDIGVSIGQFVERNFLTPGNVLRKLKRYNFTFAGGEWLTNREFSEDLSRGVCALIPQILEAYENEDAQRFLDRTIQAQMERLDVARIAAELLDALTTDNRHQSLLDHGLRVMQAWLTENRGLIEAKFSEASKYTPGFFDKYVVGRFVEGIVLLLKDITEDPRHEVRIRFDKATGELIQALRNSPDYSRRGEVLKQDLLALLRSDERYCGLWINLKTRTLNDLASDHSCLREHIAAAVVTVGEELRRDAELQQRLNNWILQAIEALMLRHGHQVSLLIADVVAQWDARQVSDKVELEIGKDLQFIRINGTLIGGTIGVALHAISLALGAITGFG